MTTNEIKKALEHCGNQNVSCRKCPLYGFSVSCIYDLKIQAFKYINQLEAEIERLKTAYPKTLESIRKIYTTAKSEAIKEFADGLKAKAQNATTWTGIEPVVTISDIDDTAKDLLIEDNVTK